MRGVATMHGPVSVVFFVPTSLTLAEVGASPAAGSSLSLIGAMLALLALFGAVGLAKLATFVSESDTHDRSFCALIRTRPAVTLVDGHQRGAVQEIGPVSHSARMGTANSPGPKPTLL